MIASPPSSSGAVNAISTEPLPRVSPVIDGASGTVAGTNDPDAAEAALLPSALVATRVHVYVLPFVRPDTVTGDAESDPDPDAPPSLESHVAV